MFSAARHPGAVVFWMARDTVPVFIPLTCQIVCQQGPCYRDGRKTSPELCQPVQQNRAAHAKRVLKLRTSPVEQGCLNKPYGTDLSIKQEMISPLSKINHGTSQHDLSGCLLFIADTIFILAQLRLWVWIPPKTWTLYVLLCPLVFLFVSSLHQFGVYTRTDKTQKYISQERRTPVYRHTAITEYT
jgi:hypothetical protein